MSLYDVSRLSGARALRGAGPDLSGASVQGRAGAAQGPLDGGVAVETEARVVAGSVPVDAERVAQIRTALREGTYPIVPARISDAIIAARLMLSGA